MVFAYRSNIVHSSVKATWNSIYEEIYDSGRVVILFEEIFNKDTVSHDSQFSIL